MSGSRKKFSRDFKIKVVQAYQSGVSAVELSRQFEVHANLIYTWAREYQKDPANAFQSDRDEHDSPKADDQRIVELERMVGRLAMENEFLKKALSHAKNISARIDLGSTKP